MATYVSGNTVDFNSNNLWVADTGVSTGERFEGPISTDGGILGTRTETYSTFAFDVGGLTYEYEGLWTITASGLVTSTVSASGTYNAITVRSGSEVVARVTGLDFNVNFGTRLGVPLLDLLSPILNPVLTLLFGGGAIEQYDNLHTGATPDIAARAFSGGDSFQGGDQNDSLFGNAGNDTLTGGAGADTMNGGDGDDVYYIDDLGDVVIDSGGNDRVFVLIDGYDLSSLSGIENITTQGGTGDNTIIGSPGDDSVSGGDGNDTANGGTGNDTLSGDGGNDVLSGGDGDDAVYGGIGNDTLSGDGGNDVISGGDGDDNLNGGIGNDTIYGDGGNDALFGDDGNDYLNGGAGIDTLSGGLGDDIYIVDSANDFVFEAPNQGTDAVYASVSYRLPDNVEILYLQSGANGTGNDQNNLIYGNSSKNTLSGRGGNDTIYGSSGNDKISGNAGHDRVDGGSGRDSIVGVSGNDTLYGGTSNDTLNGGSGNDKLEGGYGRDLIYGGSGRDTFIFRDKLSKSANLDTIRDFNPAQDRFWLDNKIFTKLGRGTESDPTKIKQAYFTIGDSAKDSNDYLIYNDDTGYLYYDRDGSGSARAVEIAKLSANLKITYHDFYVI